MKSSSQLSNNSDHSYETPVSQVQSQAAALSGEMTGMGYIAMAHMSMARMSPAQLSQYSSPTYTVYNPVGKNSAFSGGTGGSSVTVSPNGGITTVGGLVWIPDPMASMAMPTLPMIIPASPLETTYYPLPTESYVVSSPYVYSTYPVTNASPGSSMKHVASPPGLSIPRNEVSN